MKYLKAYLNANKSQIAAVRTGLFFVRTVLFFVRTGLISVRTFFAANACYTSKCVKNSAEKRKRMPFRLASSFCEIVSIPISSALSCRSGCRCFRA